MNHKHSDPPFFDKPTFQITPTRKRSSTPIRLASSRFMPSKENIPKSNSTKNINESKNEKCYVQSKKINPILSPSRSCYRQKKLSVAEERGNIKNNEVGQIWKSGKKEKYCPNHSNKLASFMIEIEDERMLYCEKCAAQLASQGFEITKLDSWEKNSLHGKKSQKDKYSLPNYPEFQGYKMYKEIVNFLKELNKIDQEHVKNMFQFQNIDNHYSQQIKMTEIFYAQLQKTIQTMREDHLNDLIEESRRHSQIAAIQHDYLRENVEEMDIMRDDIQSNLEIIIEKLQEEELFKNLNEYRQSIQVFRHKVEEQNDIFKEVINYTEEELAKKQILIQNFLIDVWQTTENHYQAQIQQPSSQGNSFEKSGKPPMPTNGKKMKKVESDNPSAFRKLFDERGQVELSPQFKKI